MIEPADVDVDSDLFSMSTTAQIRKIVKELVERLDDSDDRKVMSATNIAVMNVSGACGNSNESEVVQALTSKIVKIDLVIWNSIYKLMI